MGDEGWGMEGEMEVWTLVVAIEAAVCKQSCVECFDWVFKFCMCCCLADCGSACQMCSGRVAALLWWSSNFCW